MDYPPICSVVPTSLKSRYDKIRDAFKTRFGDDPSFFAKAPGRVNLIGEHIDYCGYAVLPMAIEQDVVFAVRPNDSEKITLTNTDPEFQDFECSINDISIDKSNPKWYYYALCGVKGVLEHCGEEHPRGFSCTVDGTVPRSAGLSSSSALVCCAAISMIHANGWKLTKKELSNVCAYCEHYIGTEGGGMDQAICFMAQEGKAKLIEFNPLKSTDVQLPEGAVFVISNSCVELNKAATSDFNIRVVEGRIASQIIAKAKGLDWQSLKRLGDLQKKLGVDLTNMTNIVKSELHVEPYSKKEVCQILDVTPEELAKTTLSANTLTVESFKLYQRALHVFEEAHRVWEFKRLGEEQAPDVLKKLGQLMSDSHTSCRDLYECSHPDLDQLVNICIWCPRVQIDRSWLGWMCGVDGSN
ncbi:N-acetylgalactosamine kinase-like isoform X2 [Gigantopelta aegis]|uniref:N-acetylgalactosamine kinase-like isoform X2 n=1 Tax=Gigantopelta aegis TaxID=1735272 RepID=UPI001B889473|nr:N-acetylgalactosamine kinase-like isoform X2 [Gigantopelta aegis]